MTNTRDRKRKGILLTLLGGTLWGLCGSCGQFLMQYKSVTSDWLVPWRLTLAGSVILLFLAVTRKTQVLEVWKEPRGRRDILIFSIFGMMLCQYSYFYHDPVFQRGDGDSAPVYRTGHDTGFSLPEKPEDAESIRTGGFVLLHGRNLRTGNSWKSSGTGRSRRRRCSGDWRRQLPS